jgi:hypothetical protein
MKHKPTAYEWTECKLMFTGQPLLVYFQYQLMTQASSAVTTWTN